MTKILEWGKDVHAIITRRTGTNISALFPYSGHTLYADIANLVELGMWSFEQPPVEVRIFKTNKHHKPVDLGNPLYERYFDDDERDFNEGVLLEVIDEFCKLADNGLPEARGLKDD